MYLNTRQFLLFFGAIPSKTELFHTSYYTTCVIQTIHDVIDVAVNYDAIIPVLCPPRLRLCQVEYILVFWLCKVGGLVILLLGVCVVFCRFS